MAKVLIVDDEVSIRLLLGELLSRRGDTVLMADDAESAVYLANSAHPDLAIVDLVLPGKGGMSLIMDNLHRITGLAIVAMSGRIPMGNDAFTAFSDQFGISCFLSKPFTVEELYLSIEKALSSACAC
jgi:DNA-binding NtrC family response regulator